MAMKLKALIVAAVGVVLMVLAFVIFSGGTDVVTINSNKLDSDANGELVFTQGQLKPRGALVDKLFGVSESEAIGLKRVVEVYQLQEQESGELLPIWSEELIPQEKKERPEIQNPSEKYVESTVFQAESFTLGVYELNDRMSQRVQLNNWRPLPFTPDQFNALPGSGKRAFKLFEGTLFYGADPNQPRIGDMRISFEHSVVNASVVAQLAGARLIADTQTGQNIQLLRQGRLNKEALVENLDLPGGTLRLIVLGLGFVMSAVGGFLFMKFKNADAPHRDQSEFATLDEDDTVHDEFDEHAGEQTEDTAGTNVGDNSGVDGSELPQDFDEIAADFSAGADIGAVEGDDMEAVAPMETPGMEDEHHDEIAPLDTPGMKTPLDEAPLEGQQELAGAKVQETVLPEAEDDGGLDFNMEDAFAEEGDITNENISGEVAEAQMDQVPPEAVEQVDNTLTRLTEEADDAFEVEEQLQPEAETNALAEEEIVAEDLSTSDISAEDTVEPISEDGFDNAAYEEDEDIPDEMFLLDDEQEEGGSEPQEVDGAEHSFPQPQQVEEVGATVETEQVIESVEAPVEDDEMQLLDTEEVEASVEADLQEDDLSFDSDDEMFLMDESEVVDEDMSSAVEDVNPAEEVMNDSGDEEGLNVTEEVTLEVEDHSSEGEALSEPAETTSDNADDDSLLFDEDGDDDDFLFLDDDSDENLLDENADSAQKNEELEEPQLDDVTDNIADTPVDEEVTSGQVEEVATAPIAEEQELSDDSDDDLDDLMLDDDWDLDEVMPVESDESTDSAEVAADSAEASDKKKKNSEDAPVDIQEF